MSMGRAHTYSAGESQDEGPTLYGSSRFQARAAEEDSAGPIHLHARSLWRRSVQNVRFHKRPMKQHSLPCKDDTAQRVPPSQGDNLNSVREFSNTLSTAHNLVATAPASLSVSAVPAPANVKPPPKTGDIVVQIDNVNQPSYAVPPKDMYAACMALLGVEPAMASGSDDVADAARLWYNCTVANTDAADGLATSPPTETTLKLSQTIDEAAAGVGDDGIVRDDVPSEHDQSMRCILTEHTETDATTGVEYNDGLVLTQPLSQSLSAQATVPHGFVKPPQPSIHSMVVSDSAREFRVSDISALESHLDSHATEAAPEGIAVRRELMAILTEVSHMQDRLQRLINLDSA